MNEEQVTTEGQPENVPAESPTEDVGVKDATQNLFDRFISIKREDIVGPVPPTFPIMTQGKRGELGIETDGNEKVFQILPTNNDLRYSIGFFDDKGNLLSKIHGVKGPYQARYQFMKGKYKMVVETDKQDMPLTAIFRE